MKSTKKDIKMLLRVNSIEKITKMMIIEIVTVGLDPDDKKSVKNYSLGMKQRLGLAQAMMENPDILILDEPMNALDSIGVSDIREILLDLKGQGKLVILASHIHEDIEILCDEVMKIEAGKVSRM